MRELRHRVPALLALALVHPGAVAAQGPVPAPSVVDLFVLDLAGTPLGGFPSGIQVLNGGMTVVDKDGQRMLRASSPSEFRIRFPQALPQNFTVEFDFIPKACCNPEDLALEGTPTINRGTGSAHVVWHREILSVVGGGTYYQAAMPEDLKQATPGMRTQLVVMFEGTTVKLYTNGRRLYTLSDRKFVRGGVLRVYLGGQDDDKYAVYLAGLRVAAGTGALGIVAATPSVPTQQGAPVAVTAPAPAPIIATVLPPGGSPAPAPISGPPAVSPGGMTPPTPGTATATNGLAGSSAPSWVAGITVTPGPQGPKVDWALVSVPATYSVKRWKSDDPACCNSSSPASPALTGPPWQDAPLPRAGPYVYEVTATFTGGSATGQAQFTHITLAGGTIATIAPTQAGANTGTATQQSAATGTGTTVAGPATLNVGSLGAGWGILLFWPEVSNATGYRVYRTVTGSASPGQITSVIDLPATITGTTTTHGAIDAAVAAQTSYTYWVNAVFADGSVSTSSPMATASLQYPTSGNPLAPAAILIGNLKVALGAQSTLTVPSGIGTGTMQVPAAELTWTWDSGLLVFRYVVSYLQTLLAAPSPTRAVLPVDGFAGLPGVPGNPTQPAPVSFTKTFAQGETVRFCVTIVEEPDPSPTARDPFPWTCLTTQVPVAAVSSTAPTANPTTAPISSGPRTLTVLSGAPAPTGVTVSGSATTANVTWYPVPGAVGYRVNRALAGTTTWTSVTPSPITTTLLAGDVLPDRTKTYTYQVLAYQASGAFGSATADFTAPAPEDPKSFAATQTGEGQVKLTWQPVSGVSEYLLSGPGTGSGAGIKVQGQEYTLNGLSNGSSTWTLASDYQPGGVLTGAAAWPKATVTVAARSGRYAIVVDGVRAERQTVDALLDGDGRGDEIFVSAFVMTWDRTSNKLLQQASLRSVTFGDVTTVSAPARLKGGSLSANGGIQSGDLISPIYAEPSGSGAGWAQLVLWQGTLTDGVEAVTIRPSIWESDNNTLPYADLRASLEAKAWVGGFGGSEGQGRMNTQSLAPVQLKWMPDFTTFAFLQNTLDRPIGVLRNASNLSSSTASGEWWDWMIVVTREALEAALNASFATTQPGVIPISFRDDGRDFQPTDPAIVGGGAYTLYLRIVRLP